jgi:hypothetical protein
MELVVYVDVYCLEFKITLGLKGAALSLDDEVVGDIPMILIPRPTFPLVLYLVPSPKLAS